MVYSTRTIKSIFADDAAQLFAARCVLSDTPKDAEVGIEGVRKSWLREFNKWYSQELEIARQEGRDESHKRAVLRASIDGNGHHFDTGNVEYGVRGTMGGTWPLRNQAVEHKTLESWLAVEPLIDDREAVIRRVRDVDGTWGEWGEF